jgi:hypothetical protein
MNRTEGRLGNKKFRQLERRLRDNEAAILRTSSTDENYARTAQSTNRSIGHFSFGLAVDRPAVNTMLQAGVASGQYYATDTFVLSIWTEAVWKSVTLS